MYFKLCAAWPWGVRWLVLAWRSCMGAGHHMSGPAGNDDVGSLLQLCGSCMMVSCIADAIGAGTVPRLQRSALAISMCA